MYRHHYIYFCLIYLYTIYKIVILFVDLFSDLYSSEQLMLFQTKKMSPPMFKYFLNNSYIQCDHTERHCVCERQD